MKTDENLPYWQHYARDFLASEEALRLSSAEEMGAFFMLMNYAWQGMNNCPQGYLPNDDSLLQRMARVTPEQWDKIGEKVLHFFPTTPDGEMRECVWLTEILGDLLTKRGVLSEAGRRGAEKRWGKGPKKSAEAPSVGGGDKTAPVQKADPEVHPDVEEVLDAWSAGIQSGDPTRHDARIWVARRLELLKQGRREVGRSSKEALLMAIDRYSQELKVRPTDCIFRVRNFFGSKNYCEAYLAPDWMPPVPRTGGNGSSRPEPMHSGEELTF